MAKSRDAIFFAKRCTSGFYAIYCNGSEEWINASYNSIEMVRKFVDAVAYNSKLTCYSLTFNENEYRYLLDN